MADRYLLESSAVDGYQLEDASGVLLLEVPVPIDDDSSSWWAGTANCFVGVAIAAAATALSANVAIAGTFKHQDEPSARMVQGQGGGSAVNRRAQQATGFQHWYQSDDIAPQTAQPIDNADGWLQTVTQQPIVSRVWSLEDDAPTPATPFAADDDWQAPRVASFTVTPMVFQGNDEIVTAALPEDAYWLAPTAQTYKPATLTAWANDERVPPAAALAGFDEGLFQFAPIVGAINAVIWATDDEIVPQEAVGYGSILRESVNILRWYQSDDVVQQATNGVVDDYWLRLDAPPAVQAVLAPQHQDELANIADPDDVWQAIASPPKPFVALWIGGDDIVPQAAALQVTDDYWLAPPAPLVAPVTLLWQQQDERQAPASPLQGEDEYWQAPPAPLVAPVNRVWSLDDAMVPQPAIDDEYARELFTIPVPPVNRIWTQQDTLVPRPGIDDEYARELFAVKVPPFNRVWVWQDEWSSGVIPDVFTVDSRERLGGRRDRIRGPRFGSASEAVPDRRIGGPNERVGSGRLGWKKT